MRGSGGEGGRGGSGVEWGCDECTRYKYINVLILTLSCAWERFCCDKPSKIKKSKITPKKNFLWMMPVSTHSIVFSLTNMFCGFN